MHIYRDHGEAEDSWTIAADPAEPCPAWSVLPLAAWRDRSAPAGPSRYGLLVRPDDEPAELRAAAERCPLIVIELAAADGRGYSAARVLRAAGYRGDLRAWGAFGRDQVLFLARCGFTSFALHAGLTAQDVKRALQEISAPYQPGLDARTPIPMLRRARDAQSGS